MSDPRSRPCSLCPQVSFTLSVCCRQNRCPPTPVAPVRPRSCDSRAPLPLLVPQPFLKLRSESSLQTNLGSL